MPENIQPDQLRNKWNQYRTNHLPQVRAKEQKWRDNNKLKDNQRKRAHDQNRPWEFKARENCRKRAREKSVPFNMRASDLLLPTTSALPEFCPIFPHIRLDYAQGPDRRLWASVDRVVPALGYVTGNVWVVSQAANTWKSNGSNPQERAIITKLMAPKIKPPRATRNLFQTSLFN